MMARETYYEALFAQFSTLLQNGTVQTCDRVVLSMDEMASAQLPALFMTVSHQPISQEVGSPPIHTLTAMVFLFAEKSDRHTSGGIALNHLLDALEATIAPDWTGSQTLGGLVESVLMAGRVEIYEGDQGKRAAAIATIQMIVP